MRRSTFLAIAALLLAPARARAEGDISEAVRFSSEVIEDDLFAGLEDFVDEDPDEALSMLLSQNVVPGRPPEDYVETDGIGIGIRYTDHTLESLGSTRLSFGALRPYIEEAAQLTRFPPALIDAVIRTESGYRPRAVSKRGALGLMQLMPETAREVGVRDPMDPRDNILGGARYLRRMVDQFGGSIRLGVAAYNAGPGAVAKHNGVPPYWETQRYVETVLGRFKNSRVMQPTPVAVAPSYEDRPAPAPAAAPSPGSSVISGMMRSKR